MSKADAAPPPSNNLPPELWSIVSPALQVGGITGASGFLVGGAAGIIKSSSTPTLFALASGIQWFTLGSSYWGAGASRSLLLQRGVDDSEDSMSRMSASSIAGAISGATGGLLRGPRNIIPGAIVFALVGAAGQTIYDMADTRHSARLSGQDDERKKKWLDSKWSPVTVVSDEKYEEMLHEKLLRVDAEIALLDDDIATLKGSKGDPKS